MSGSARSTHELCTNRVPVRWCEGKGKGGIEIPGELLISEGTIGLVSAPDTEERVVRALGKRLSPDW
jgi:hypothetical protein